MVRVWWCAHAGTGLLVSLDVVKDGEASRWSCLSGVLPVCGPAFVIASVCCSAPASRWTLPASDKEPVRGMSHREHNRALFSSSLILFLCSKWESCQCTEGDVGTLHWTTRAVKGAELSVPWVFWAVDLAAASLLSSSSSERRLLSLSSGDSLSSVESSAVLSLLSSASACPSLLSAKGERTLALGSRASPRSLVMFPSSRRRWTMLWGCFREGNRWRIDEEYCCLSWPYIQLNILTFEDIIRDRWWTNNSNHHHLIIPK